MGSIYIERGRIIETRPEVVLCLWENWDIFDAIHDGKYNIKAVEKGIFTAKLIGIKSRLEHVKTEIKTAGGEVTYLLSANGYLTTTTTLVSLKFSIGTGGNTSVFGSFDAQINGVFSNKIFNELFNIILKKISDEFIKNGEEACVFIEKHPDELKNKLTEAQIRILNDYLNKKIIMANKEQQLERNILRYAKENNGIIKAGDLAIYLNENYKDIKEILNKFADDGCCDFNKIENKYLFKDFHSCVSITDNNYDLLGNRLDILDDRSREEFDVSRRLIEINPTSSIIQTGKIIETITKEVYNTYYKDNNNYEVNFNGMIVQLSNDNKIPRNIEKWMHTIRLFRNEATHGKTGFNNTEALDILNAALNVAEWHMNEFTNKKL
jgi:hypothetical protein